MSSSQSSLQYDKLFSETGTNKVVYFTDKIYGYKNLDTDFDKMVRMGEYLNTVSDVTVRNSSVTSTQGDLTTNSSVTKSWDTVRISYKKGGLNTETVERIYNDMIVSLGNPNDMTVKQQLAEVATNHRKASVFMENVILSVCNWKFANVRTEVVGSLVNNTQVLSDVKEAGKEIQLLTGPKEASILANLHNTCSEVLAAMVKNQAPSTFLLSGFVEGDDFVFNEFRKNLSEAMFPKLILREYAGNNTIKDKVLMFVRRILIEMYIISYYPYIHFLYINELYKKFQQSGNFVNMRVAALIRVAFTINVLMSFFNYGADKFSGQTKVDKQSVIITQWVETLKNYMTALSRVDFENKDLAITDLISNLHSLSSKVTSQSMSVDELKENIKASQLQVRSIVSRLRQVNKERSRNTTFYTLLVLFTILLIIISAVLIVFNFHKQNLLIILTGLSVYVLLVIVLNLFVVNITTLFDPSQY